MAVVYNNIVNAILLDSETGNDSGLYKINGSVKRWTGTTALEAAQTALSDMLKIYGDNEFRIVMDVDYTITGTITTESP